jgi:hypothetical protein
VNEGHGPAALIKAVTAGLVGNLSYTEIMPSGRGFDVNNVRVSDRFSGKIPRDSAFIPDEGKLFVFQKPVEITFAGRYGEQRMNLFQTIQEISPELLWEVAPQLCYKHMAVDTSPLYDSWEDGFF